MEVSTRTAGGVHTPPAVSYLSTFRAEFNIPIDIGKSVIGSPSAKTLKFLELDISSL